jgi:V/A-type H+-transporting ATPase subunit F
VKRLVVATPPDARHGFALTGVQQLTLEPAQLPERLRALVADPAIGLVIVDERLAPGEVQAQVREIEWRWPGMIVVLPAPEAMALPEEDYVLRLIRRAIGYQVRLGT